MLDALNGWGCKVISILVFIRTYSAGNYSTMASGNLVLDVQSCHRFDGPSFVWCTSSMRGEGFMFMFPL